jgi:hypothetical protein
MTAPAACCDMCHTCYPHHEMSVVDLPDGGKAWVCHGVERAIFSEPSGERHAGRRRTPGMRMHGRLVGAGNYSKH